MKKFLILLTVAFLSVFIFGCDNDVETGRDVETERTLKSISVKTQPTKTTYHEDDYFEADGLVLTASYSDKTTETITSGYDCYPLKFSGPGKSKITVEYEGKTTTLKVTVQPGTLTGITVATNPSKTTYMVGESLDISGLTLTATYSDGYTQTVTGHFQVSGSMDFTKVGTETYNVYYHGKETSFTVNVERAKLTNVAVGDTINWGNLEWNVLAVDETKALLITKDIVIEMVYNDTIQDITWETCTLRTWLNSTFLTTYIPSSSECERILMTTVVNDDNLTYGIKGGNTTYDKVFLLSIAEANAYFSSDSDRLAYYNGSAFASGWWLRSPGVNSDCAALVYDAGEILESGYIVGDSELFFGVRPAVWVELDQ